MDIKTCEGVPRKDMGNILPQQRRALPTHEVHMSNAKTTLTTPRQRFVFEAGMSKV